VAAAVLRWVSGVELTQFVMATPPQETMPATRLVATEWHLTACMSRFAEYRKAVMQRCTICVKCKQNRRYTFMCKCLRALYIIFTGLHVHVERGAPEDINGTESLVP